MWGRLTFGLLNGRFGRIICLIEFDVQYLRVINLTMKISSSCRRLTGVVLLAGWLSGCSGKSDIAEDVLTSIGTPPGAFTIYNCEQIAEKAQWLVGRQIALQELIVKAETGVDGRIISRIAYRPEYYSLRGQFKEIRREADAKNCKALPGDVPVKRNSDDAIR